ncbi:unnamed protein product [Amoebophrya sp. A25]|nr:unnamed protein product [Amoebophrya sp. A25]|eukprot:GSA25T00009385001.1
MTNYEENMIGALRNLQYVIAFIFGDLSQAFIQIEQDFVEEFVVYIDDVALLVREEENRDETREQLNRREKRKQAREQEKADKKFEMSLVIEARRRARKFRRNKVGRSLY